MRAISSTKLSFTLCLVCLLTCESAWALKWTKLNESKESILLLDKESVIVKDNLKKAWLKIQYKKTQQNYDNPDIEFNLSKVLWYFNCADQQSATSQIAQYLNGKMVYSAGIDVKKAEFVDPIPETDVDIAMRFTCEYDRAEEEAKIAKRIADEKAAKEAKKKAAEEARKAEEEAFKKAEQAAAEAAEQEKALLAKAASEEKETKGKKKSNKKDQDWSYDGDTGPEHWAELNPNFTTCTTGHNQSPIDLDKGVNANLEKIRSIEKFPAKDIQFNGQAVQVNFNYGNMLVLDDDPYQMKFATFHAPSEHTIKGKAFPMEAHFAHSDGKGNLTYVSVMFKMGKPNKAITNLWAQLSNEKGEAEPLKARVVPNELLPTERSYYRFNGSITMPPCTEGVKWIVFKTPITASKEQINKLKSVMQHPNNRPIQPINGRIVLE